MPIPLQHSVVYGPVPSRRLGRSLGINILPTEAKFCLSNCIYCQYGPTDLRAMKKERLRPAVDLLKDIEWDFEALALEGVKVDTVTFSGNGEPTLHPEFDVLVHEVKHLRNIYFAGAKVVILSDSTRVHLPEIREVLEALDERYMKLDAGTAEICQQINRPIGKCDWDERIEGLKRLRDVTLQSLFISAPYDNSTGLPLRCWLEAVAAIRPKGVHVYTVSRSPADPRVKSVSPKRLSEIAKLVRQADPSCEVIAVTDEAVEFV